ncbi:PD-(D/E)XK nuclease family protein [Candidatus Woesearchaeota archaeon]|nr:PD-(D/E)XK nuclease family protein [Candidatus Woesearchaeota archaeon]
MAKRIQSPSSINTFKQCMRKYYYQYIECLPTLPNIHQVRGNIAHSTLENFYTIDVSQFNEENYTQKFSSSLQQLFLHQWKQYLPKLQSLHLHPDQERFYFEETMLMLMNWGKHFLEDLKQLRTKKNISIAEAFLLLTPIREQEMSSQEWSVRGFIDAIHQFDDEVHIIDYKTNSSFEMKDSMVLQLAIYSLLYSEKHGKMPDKVGIFFLRQKLKMMKVEKEHLELAKKEIAAIHEHTSKTEDKKDYKCSPSPLCKWSSGQCDFYETCKPFAKG